MKTGTREVLLLEKHLPQFEQRGLQRHRHHVGTGRHDIADLGVAKIHDRLDEPAVFALNQAFLLSRFEVRMRDLARVVLAVLGRLGLHRAGVPRRAQRRDETDQAQRNRTDGPLEQFERGQEPDQHLLGIAPHDQQRQEVLEHDDEPGHRQQQHAGILRVVDSGQRREDDGGDCEDQP